MSPPHGVDPPSQGSADVVDSSGGSRDESNRFLFRPLALETGGASPPVVGTSGTSLLPGVRPQDASTHFGGGQPIGMSGRSGDSALPAGGSRPHPVPEPSGGSSSRAPPGSAGFFDESCKSVIAQVVRDEVEKSLEKFSPSTREKPSRRSEGRWRLKSAARRYLNFDSKSESTKDSGASPPRRPTTRVRDDSPRTVPGKIVVNNPQYTAVFDCEKYGLANKSLCYTRSQARTLGRQKKDVSQSFGVRS